MGDGATEDKDSPAISIHALSGYSSSQTTRIPGWIKHQIVSVLIDSGSTHNFISTKMARLFDWPVHQSSSFEVLETHSNRLECSAKCIDLEIDSQSYQFQLDIYLLPLKGSDVVLGIQWLQKLGLVL